MSASATTRPSSFHPIVNAYIPSELKDRPQWVVWRFALRDDKWTKVPYQPGNPSLGAKADKPSTWGTFAGAMRVYDAGEADGIGYEFSRDDPYFGVDVDNCVQPAVSEGGGWYFEEWSSPILQILDGTYGEISPSGKGVKFIARGKLPGDKGTKRGGMGPDGTGGLELYDHGRFFTITGFPWVGKPDPIADMQVAIEALYDMAKKRPSKARAASRSVVADHRSPVTGNAVHDDEEVLRAAGYSNGFSDLYRGGLNGFPSPSEADLALMSRLAFYCGPGQEEQVKRLFLGSKLGERDKAARPDYLERTVAKAYENRIEYFDWTPRTVIGESGGSGPPPSANGTGNHDQGDDRDRLDAELAKFPCTDIGNGERLVRRFGNDLHHCHPWGKWLVWDGRRWEMDQTAAVHRNAKATVRSLLREAATLADESAVKLHAKWWRESEGSSRVNAMLARAAAEKGIPILPKHLDPDPLLFNCPNGTIDLRTGKLRAHRRGDLITQLCPVEFDAMAQCRLWDEVLKKVFADNQDMIGFVQRLFGVALTGDVSEQILPIFYGCGANGKSTILTAILEMMGEDYAIMAPPGLLTIKRGETHPTERAALFGKRLVVDMESAEGARLNEAWVKQLTGSDKISARRMREDFWTFAPTHKVVMGTNHRPEIRETKNAIWRRVKLVPFTVAIPETEQDMTVPAKLRAEYPGILAWCVRGCVAWRKDGLKPPQEVKDATAEYRAEQDVLSEFISQECIVNEQLSARATPLYERYRQWTGTDCVTQRAFGRAMTERGFRRKENHGIHYLGIGLRASQDEDSRVPF
jgi:putative DNA primase/helicase